MPFSISRPSDGISLNAGFPEFICNEDESVMLFESHADAIAWLAGKDVAEDELDDMLITINKEDSDVEFQSR
tara:strand:+ start:771 stop:986 length:216 start_codon:yes stop_codon:yes gene_type:complete